MDERYEKVVDKRLKRCEVVDLKWKRWEDCWLKIEEMRRWLIKDIRDEKMVDWRLKRWEDGWLKIKEMRRLLIED